MVKVHPENDTREKEGGTTGSGSLGSGGRIQRSSVPENRGWRGVQEAGGIWRQSPLNAGVLWTKKRVYAVLWGVRRPMNDADEVAAAVQRVLASAQEGHQCPERMPDSVWRQVIPRGCECLYGALSALEGEDGRAAAAEARRAFTEGYMALPLQALWAQRVMRDAGVRTLAQYLHKVHTGEICGGACEVRRLAQQRGCRIAIHREWRAKRVYRKMREVGEGGRAAAALLWSRRGGGHYELLWPAEREGEGEEVERDKRETTDMEEVGLEVESVTGGELEEDQGTRGRPGAQEEERVWQDVQQVLIQGGGGQCGSTRGKSVPCENEERSQREADVTGGREPGGNGFWGYKCTKWSMREYQRVRVRETVTGGSEEEWTSG